MSKKSNANSFRTDAVRALTVLGLASVLGLVVNAFSAHSMPIFPEEPFPVAPSKSVPGEVDLTPGKVSLDNLLRLQKDPNQDVRIVDVRGEAAFDTGHIPNAIHAPKETILKSRQMIDAALTGATLIAVMCDSDACSKAEDAADVLTRLGFKNVRVLLGGWDGYKKAGYPVEEARH